MTSFLSTCPGCGTMIPRDTVCPNCKTSTRKDDGGDSAAANQDYMQQYSANKAQHTTNYTIKMCLMMGTGIIGAITAVMWFLFMFAGSVGAFFWIIILTILTFILGGVITVSNNLFPTALHCPACSVDLEELGLNNGCCPGCNHRLA